MPADVDAIHALELASFAHNQLSRRSIRAFIAAPHRPLLTAKVAGALAGYVVLAMRSNARAGRLYSIAVDKAFARKGVGRALIAAAEAYCLKHGCDSLRLEVRKDNTPAIALYEAHGYRPFAEYSDYYADGAAALRMEKRLG